MSPGQETAFFSGQSEAEQGQLLPPDRKRRTDSIPYLGPVPAHDSVIVEQGSSCYGARCLDANLMLIKAYSPPNPHRVSLLLQGTLVTATRVQDTRGVNAPCQGAPSSLQQQRRRRLQGARKIEVEPISTGS